MSRTRFCEVRAQRQDAAEVVTRLVLAGYPNIAKMHAETVWQPLHEEYEQLLAEDTEATE